MRNNVQYKKCTNSLPHESHYWRTSLLYLKRNYCVGIKENATYWERANPSIGIRIKDHKHFFRIDEAQTNGCWVSWKCEECSLTHDVMRRQYEFDTLGWLPIEWQ